MNWYVCYLIGFFLRGVKFMVFFVKIKGYKLNKSDFFLFFLYWFLIIVWWVGWFVCYLNKNNFVCIKVRNCWL